MGFAEEIKKLRIENNLTQAELAKILDVSDKSVSGWENGVALPRMGIVEKLSEHFNIRKSVLMGETLKSNARRIPVYGYIPAGIPLEAITDISEWEEISNDMPGTYFALKVHGNSMYPHYFDGDIVICRKQDDCENKQCCAVLIDGEDATLKQVIKDGTSITLQPINPQYKAKTFQQGDDVRILGVVVELRRKENV